MGAAASKKKKLEINEVDRAVLTLKTQARKLEQQRTRIQGNVDRELAVAKELVASGRKERALLALKRKKLQEGQAARLDAWLLNVEEMLLNLETAKNQQRLFAALKEGTSAVKEMQTALPLEEVEQLMQDGADAKEYEDSLRQMLGESLNAEEAEAAAEELQQLEAQLMDEQQLELPRAPDAALPAAPQAEQQAAAGEAAEELLAELPSVPQTRPVALPAGKEAAAAEEAEAERVLVAA
ncbi:vacuolar sorting-associated 20-like protein 2-like [Micractinium conductrix]|uniref:Vacuolar sorting-associated 20-like protein 2-like n=1 Tax=Micractinium conductrix TaxID=554055 RepID=A0A2P6VHD3_9CHLO|nr:vacuolar sorting-associated 20-like protein 2-like [Micractinium conductrix]|eukprot:PSC73503.1 vacuolar sorting-associated 20-like protein 2-like [Micractinium conductrix]